MKGVISEPHRLRDRLDQPDAIERIAGQAARDSAEPEPLSAIAMARISVRIDARRGQQHRVTPLARLLVVGAFLLGIVAAASAAHLDLLPRWLGRSVPAASPHSPRATPETVKRRGPAGQAAPAVTPAPGPAPARAAEGQTAPAPNAAPATQVAAMPSLKAGSRGLQQVALRVDRVGAPARAASSQTAPAQSAASPAVEGPRLDTPALRPASEAMAAPTQPHAGTPAISAASPARKSAVPDEAMPPAPAQTPGVLKQVVRALRVERAPSRALALLDQHRDELAGQAFAEEALLLRVEAMLALGERADVLRLLDRTSLSELAVSSTLLITRGELRAAANRCAEGIGDFDLVLAASPRPPKQALLGRARCNQQLGDAAGAEADMARYRREFPQPERH